MNIDEAFLDETQNEIDNIDKMLREFAYDNYKISLESLTDILALENSFELLTESDNIDIVLEGKMFDTIKRILSNWMKNTSTAWQRFKELISDKKYDNFISDNQKYFEIQDSMYIPVGTELAFPLAIKKFISINSIPSFTKDMLDELESKEKFIKSNYVSSLYKDYIEEGKTIKEVAISKCIKKTDDPKQTVDTTAIKSYIDNIADMHNIIDNLTKDINALNKSSQDILNSIKDQETTTESYNSLKDYYLIEGDNSNKNIKGETQEKGTAIPNQSNTADDKPKAWKSANDDGNGGEKKETKNYTKEVNNYLGVCTEILSSKMYIANKSRSKMFIILQKWVAMEKEKAGDKNKPAKEEKNETRMGSKEDNTIPQVNP